jgi:signal transduction histidine kinase
VSAADAPQNLARNFVGSPAIRFGSLILALLLLGATGVIGLATVQRMKASRETVLHTYKVRGLLKDLRSDIGESHANFDLYLLSRNPDEGRDLEQQAEQQIESVEELQNLTKDNPTQQQRLERFRTALEEDIKQLHDCVGGLNCLGTETSGKSDQLAILSARRRTMSAMLLNMETSEAQLLQGRLAMWDQLFRRMVITLVGSFILALILLLYSFNLLLGEIEQRKEQEKIEKKNAESYKMLSARILELQDVERRKIARELHDSVGQYLAGLKLNLGRLQRRDLELAQQNQPLVSESLELTDRAIGEVRTISHLLHPPLLDELGFHSAARWYAEGFAKRSGVKVELRLTEIVERLPKEIELALFRVLQESLTNIHRHAKASRVNIEVDCTDVDVLLTVRDNGHGIQRNILDRYRAGEAGGIGLAGMRERLAELGGTLEVESSSSGTQIRATLPTRECDPKDVLAEDITIAPDGGAPYR